MMVIALCYDSFNFTLLLKFINEQLAAHAFFFYLKKNLFWASQFKKKKEKKSFSFIVIVSKRVNMFSSWSSIIYIKRILVTIYIYIWNILLNKELLFRGFHSSVTIFLTSKLEINVLNVWNNEEKNCALVNNEMGKTSWRSWKCCATALNEESQK